MNRKGWLITLALVAVAVYLAFAGGFFMHGD